VISEYRYASGRARDMATFKPRPPMPVYSHLRRLAVQKRELWHSQRAELFVNLIRPRGGARLLDVGGLDGEFMERVLNHVDVSVTIADIDDAGLATARRRGFATVRLEEGQPLPFADDEFDIVFSNSVIEHVTHPKADCINKRFSDREWVETSFRNQHHFAQEIQRVGRNYFVQTPHRSFPIEAHTWLPFVGWLPHDATVRLVRITDRVWAKRCGFVDWNLLGEREMRQLFPHARIHVERLLGMPKSLVAYRGDM